MLKVVGQEMSMHLNPIKHHGFERKQRKKMDTAVLLSHLDKYTTAFFHSYETRFFSLLILVH